MANHQRYPIMAEAAPAADPPEGSAAAAVDPEVDSQWALAAVGADGAVQLYSRRCGDGPLRRGDSVQLDADSPRFRLAPNDPGAARVFAQAIDIRRFPTSIS